MAAYGFILVACDSINHLQCHLVK